VYGIHSTQFPAHLTRQIALPRFLAILPCLAVLALSACASTEKPGIPLRQVELPPWVRSAKHPEFPEQTHLSVMAAGEGVQAARKNADDLLERAITEEALIKAGERFANTKLSELLRGPAAWLSVSEFGDSVKRDFAGDGFESFAISGIDRNDLKLRSLGLLVPAQQRLASDVAPPELDDVCARVLAWSARFLLAARVVALAILARDELERAAFEAAEGAALQLARVSTLMEVRQDGALQRARLLGGLESDLLLTASFRERMPKGLKLRWSIEAPAGGYLSGFNEFNAIGQASCKVLSIASSGSAMATVRAAIDVDAMAGAMLGLVMPPWRWQVTVPSRSQVLLDIEVSEKLGQDALDPTFAAAFIEWARLNGLALSQDQGPLPDERFVYRIKLAGELRVTVLKRGTQWVSRAEGQVTLSDAETGHVVFRYSPAALLEAPGDGKASELARVTLSEAAADTLLEFGARVLALFPAPMQ
jgi:hypothetical protein